MSGRVAAAGPGENLAFDIGEGLEHQGAAVVGMTENGLPAAPQAQQTAGAVFVPGVLGHDAAPNQQDLVVAQSDAGAGAMVPSKRCRSGIARSGRRPADRSEAAYEPADRRGHDGEVVGGRQDGQGARGIGRFGQVVVGRRREEGEPRRPLRTARRGPGQRVQPLAYPSEGFALVELRDHQVGSADRARA